MFYLAIIAVVSFGSVTQAQDSAQDSICAEVEGKGRVCMAATSAQAPSARPRSQKVFLDEHFSASESEAILDALAEPDRLVISAPEGSWYEQAFGGRGADVLRAFIEKRVRYLIRSDISGRDRVESSEGSYAIYAANTDAFGFVLNLFSMLKAPYEALLLVKEGKLPPLEKPPGLLELNGRRILVESPRDGVILIGDAFYPPSAHERLVSLIHEGRHSDCTPPRGKSARTFRNEYQKWNEGVEKLYTDFRRALLEASRNRTRLSVEVYNSLVADNNKLFRERGEILSTYFYDQRDAAGNFTRYRPECRFLHVTCPDDFTTKLLRGRSDACDAVPWSAYWTDAVASQGIAKHCLNCTAIEKQIALARASDSFHRVLILDKLEDGTYGKPVMDSIE